jgi:hypothetical protein
MYQLKEEVRQIFGTPKDWVEGLFSLSDWLKDQYFGQFLSSESTIG